MKFRIKDEVKDKEQILELHLEQDADDCIILCGVESDGTEWHLLSFENGKVSTIPNLPDDIGLEVDKNGELEIYYAEN